MLKYSVYSTYSAKHHCRLFSEANENTPARRADARRIHDRRQVVRDLYWIPGIVASPGYRARLRSRRPKVERLLSEVAR